MTKLSYIHGLPSAGYVPINEFADRARQVPQRSFINFSTLTEGELKLALALEQSELLASFYPENKEFRKISETLKNALYLGVHGPSGEKYAGVENTYARRIIQLARTQRGPAAKLITDRENTLQGPDEPLRKNALQECGRPPGKILGVFNTKKQKEWEKCMDQIGYQNLLNQKLESSAHHILYNFEKNPNSAPNSVAAKKVLHATAIYKWAEITGISADNIALWVRNGVMRGNTKQGLEPLQPEASIDLMRNAIPAKYESGVGAIDPVTLGLLIKLFVAITGAIGATATLLASLKAKDQLRFQSSLSDMGLPPFGPEEGDWITDGQGRTAQQQGFLSSNLLIPAAGAAAAYLIFSKS
jgi:hypothetical protein